jgi:hypothetical protein
MQTIEAMGKVIAVAQDSVTTKASSGDINHSLFVRLIHSFKPVDSENSWSVMTYCKGKVGL